MEIKFCRNNFTHGTEDVVTKLVDNHPEVKVVVESCLNHCKTCQPGPYAMVNNSLVIAQTCDELYDKIEDSI